MKNYLNFDRETYNFISQNSATPNPVQVEQAALMRLTRIIPFGDSSSPAMVETVRRIHLLGEQIFCSSWPIVSRIFPHSATGLVEITAYIDALPKRLGYAYMNTLRREAELLIPASIVNEFDIDELLQAFRIWRRNWSWLNCPLLIVGLFLLFFQRCTKMTDGANIRWDFLVDNLLFAPENILRESVMLIIKNRGEYRGNDEREKRNKDTIL